MMVSEKKASGDLPDWSGRHVRLRFELLLCSVVFFLLATKNAELNNASLWPIKLTHASVSAADPSAGEMVLWILGVIYVYLCAAFALRTYTENATLTSFAAQTTAAMGQVDENIKKFATLLNSKDITSLDDKLQTWADRWMESIKLPKSIAADANKVISALEGFKSVIPSAESAMAPFVKEGDVIEVLRPRITDMSKANDGFERAIRHRAEEIAGQVRLMTDISKELNLHVANAKSFVGGPLTDAAAELNQSTREAVENLAYVRTSLLRGKNAFSWERYGIAVVFPGLVSLALMVAPLWWHWRDAVVL